MEFILQDIAAQVRLPLKHLIKPMGDPEILIEPGSAFRKCSDPDSAFIRLHGRIRTRGTNPSLKDVVILHVSISKVER